MLHSLNPTCSRLSLERGRRYDQSILPREVFREERWNEEAIRTGQPGFLSQFFALVEPSGGRLMNVN